MNSSIHDWYLTADRTYKFEFVFMDCGPQTGWRVYIISSIDYKGRDATLHATHRNYVIGETYHYICWDRKIETLKEARAICVRWSEITVKYIRTGISFDVIAKQMIAR